MSPVPVYIKPHIICLPRICITVKKFYQEVLQSFKAVNQPFWITISSEVVKPSGYMLGPSGVNTLL